MATTKRTPQKPKPAARKPKAKATKKAAPRRKPDPRRAPEHGFIPSDNPHQSRDH